MKHFGLVDGLLITSSLERISIPSNSSTSFHSPKQNMSFPNYEAFQGQSGTEEGNGAPGMQQPQGQMGQPTGNSPGQYQGGGQGMPPGAAGVDQQSGDSKTTLW